MIPTSLKLQFDFFPHSPDRSYDDTGSDLQGDRELIYRAHITGYSFMIVWWLKMFTGEPGEFIAPKVNSQKNHHYIFKYKLPAQEVCSNYMRSSGDMK